MSENTARIWTNEPSPLILLSPNIIQALPNGVVLESIYGRKVVKGKDAIDLDSRLGVTTFGVRIPRQE